MAHNPNTDFYTRHKSLINLLLRCLIVFIIPIIAGLVFFKQRGIYPYGDNSLLSVDLWGQYFPMYRQFADSNSFSEAMYSWNGALGFNNFVQSAFYCRSLFLLIFKIVPLNSSIAYINYVCLLRLGISAVTCLLFLEYKFRKKSPVIMAASICYGLCAYSIAFIMQFMWTDCIMYAPLILLGLERLMEGKSPLLYVIMLTLTIYTNFYVGFGVCLFTLFYFIAEAVKKAEFGHGIRVLFDSVKKPILRFALYSLLSGAMTAVIAIPTLKGLSLSISANTAKVDFSQWYHTLSENVNAMLPQTGISLEYGVANIATGLFMFILIPLYFLNSSVRFREKLASGAFLFALYCGLNYNPMDYVFNGFHFANQLPGRWSFLFSLAIVIIAANGIAKSEGINQKNIISSWIVGVFFLLFSRYSTLSPLKEESLNSWFMLLTVFCMLLSLYVTFSRCAEQKKASENAAAQDTEVPEIIADNTDDATVIAAEDAGTSGEKLAITADNNESEKTTVIAEAAGENAADGDAPKERTEEKTEIIASLKKIFSREMFFRGASFITSLAMAVLMTYEVSANAVDVAAEINGGVGVSNMSSYLNVTELFSEYADMFESGSDDFYRIENNTGWTFNDGQLAGYKGMTYYGSTLNGNVYNFMRFMGNRIYAQGVSTVYNNSSAVQNSLFGLRYFIDRGKNLNTRLPGVTAVQDNSDCIIWENPTALPLAYAVSANVENINVTDEIRAIKTQNDVVNMMYGEDINVYEKQTAAAFSYENCVLNENANWNENHFYCQDSALPVKFNYTYICPSEQPIYIEQNFRAGQMTVTANGTATQVDVGSELFKYIGTYPAGTEINISFEATGIGIGCFGLELYSFNTEKWQTVYNKLNSSSLDVTSFKNTKIEGTLNMAEAGVVFTSIPQDGGWKVYVDGEKVDDFMIADTLVGFTASAGTHEITFKYSVPAYGIGLTVSIITLLITVMCLYIHKKGGWKRNTPSAEIAAQGEEVSQSETGNKQTTAADTQNNQIDKPTEATSSKAEAPPTEPDNSDSK